MDKMSEEAQELKESIELIIITAKLMGYQTENTNTGAWRIVKDGKQYLRFNIVLGIMLVVTDEKYNQHILHKNHQEKLTYLQKVLEEL